MDASDASSDARHSRRVRFSIWTLLGIAGICVIGVGAATWQRLNAFNALTAAKADLHVRYAEGSIRERLPLEYIPFVDEIWRIQINSGREDFRRLVGKCQRFPTAEIIVVLQEWPEDACAALKEINHLKCLVILEWDDRARCLSELTDLRSLSVESPRFGDEDLPLLEPLKSLDELGLSDTMITDEGLSEMNPPPDLRVLRLSGTAVTHIGLEPFVTRPSLTALALHHTSLTDDAIPTLSRFGNLEYLSITGTDISEDGADRLRNLLPSTNIFSD